MSTIIYILGSRMKIRKAAASIESRSKIVPIIIRTALCGFRSLGEPEITRRAAPAKNNRASHNEKLMIYGIPKCLRAGS